MEEAKEKVAELTGAAQEKVEGKHDCFHTLISKLLLLSAEVKQDVQEKGNVSRVLINPEGVLHFHPSAEQVKEQAGEKVDEAKEKASEVAAAAQETAQGKWRLFFTPVLTIDIFWVDVKETVQEKGKILLLFALIHAFSAGCFLAEEVKDKAAEKVDEVKETASAVASDASAAAAGIWPTVTNATWLERCFLFNV